jgi:DNA-binding MarR family transcriptional regulator
VVFFSTDVDLSLMKKGFGRVFELFNQNAEPMRIDKEIKQATFRNNQNKAMVNIMFTHAWMVDHIKSFVKSENITPQQYNILRILRGAGEPLSTLQLRERMLDKMSDTSRIVERMVSKNLVQKAVSEKDKRMVDVIITPQGSELLENLDRRNEELDAVVNHLSDEELETLNNLLDKLRNNH